MHDLKKIKEILAKYPQDISGLEPALTDDFIEYGEHIRKQTIEDCKEKIQTISDFADSGDTLKSRIIKALNELE